MVITTTTPLLVTCLCAQWCSTCREYQGTFHRVAQSFPDVRFVWVDIEDEAELVDPIEVENFPTVLIAEGEVPLFFGPITPQPETLARLVRSHATPRIEPLQRPELNALVGKIRQKTG